MEFIGCRLNTCTLDEAVALAGSAMRQRNRLQHGDVNVAKFITFRRDRELLPVFARKRPSVRRRMGIVWGCRLLGLSLPERVTGVDLMMRLIDVCAWEGFRPYFFGATQEVREAIAQVRRHHPHIDIAGWRNGYFASEDEADIVGQIREAGANCLFVGISSPTKERFLNQHRDALNVPVQLGVGGALDVLAGHTARVPRWMQKSGLEWFFRFAQEPRCLWWRYLATNTQYAGVLAVAVADKVGRQLLGIAARR